MPGHQIVKGADSKSHAFELADHGGLICTVGTLKELVVPASNTQRLVFAGKEKEDDSTPADVLNIAPGLRRFDERPLRGLGGAASTTPDDGGSGERISSN